MNLSNTVRKRNIPVSENSDPKNETQKNNDKQTVKCSASLNSHQNTLWTKQAKATFITITILACITRLLFLNHPNEIVFDEVHFGGFANKYIWEHSITMFILR